MILSLYSGVMTIGLPAIESLLRRRVARGKEDAARLGERRGVGSLPRPGGTLVWVHAASVGESVAALALVRHMVETDPDRHVLVTTGTVTSAKLLVGLLPDRAIHQYLPVDRPAWVSRFLDHWKPDLGVFVESELWPNLIRAARSRSIPLALVNARMSQGSYRRWRRVGPLASPVFRSFDLALATDTAQGERLRKLGIGAVEAVGNLKMGAPALSIVDDDRARLKSLLGSRPVWLAASTHPGEDEIVLDAHAVALLDHPDLLTILAPRHPTRGDDIAALCRSRGLTVARRSLGDEPRPDTAIYLVDTLGEMGAFMSVAPIVFVAGSFVPVGGHNPIEPAHFGCAILFGPLMAKNRDIASEMVEAGAARQLEDGSDLGPAIRDLLAKTDDRQSMANAAAAVVDRHKGVVARIADRLLDRMEDGR